MMSLLKRSIKSQNAQIGQILVVVVLIVLAVMGISKFIMPAFTTSTSMMSVGNSKLNQINSSISSGVEFKAGEVVNGTTLANIVDYFASNSTGIAVIVKYKDSSSTETVIGYYNISTSSRETPATGATESAPTFTIDDLSPDWSGTVDTQYRINSSASYSLTQVQKHANGSEKAVVYQCLASN